MAGLQALLEKPAVQFGISAAVVFGVQRLVPTYKRGWYESIKKPQWTPPNYVFPLVWIPLKLMQSAAAMLVWQAGAGAPLKLGLALGTFGSHLYLGNMWNVIFFGRHDIPGSINWMGAFWLSTLSCIGTFRLLSLPAAALMAPTLAWVTVAAKLNSDILRLNHVPAPKPDPAPEGTAEAKPETKAD